MWERQQAVGLFAELQEEARREADATGG